MAAASSSAQAVQTAAQTPSAVPRGGFARNRGCCTPRAAARPGAGGHGVHPGDRLAQQRGEPAVVGEARWVVP